MLRHSTITKHFPEKLPQLPRIIAYSFLPAGVSSYQLLHITIIIEAESSSHRTSLMADTLYP
jgi:hypothetical protein